MYTKEALTELKSKVDIVQYLEEQGTKLTQSGATYKGLCPVHAERSPSFHVKADSQTFQCFGCGASGDIIALLMAMQNLTFTGAVQELSDYTGVRLEMAERDENWEARRRLYNVISLSAEWYRRNYTQLPLDHPAKQNLASRNLYEFSITDESVGYAPRSGLMELLQRGGFTLDEMVAAGVVRVREDKPPSEVFRDRLMWTVYDTSGRPIGFSGRRLDDTSDAPKYVNSPQTDLYNKSKTLLGLSDARQRIMKEQIVYVVEGQTDVMAMKAAGFENTVASCGTAFGAEHANMLLHLSSKGQGGEKFQIVFCFDGDAAGKKATWKVFAQTPTIHKQASVVPFLDEQAEAIDPCDYRIRYGDERLQEMVGAQQKPIIEYLLDALRPKWNMKSPEGVDGYINDARKILQHVEEPLIRRGYVRKVALWTGLPVSEAERLLAQGAQRPRPTAPQQSGPSDTALPAMPQDELQLIAFAVQYPNAFGSVVGGMDTSTFVARELAGNAFSAALMGESLDTSDKQVAELFHVELMVGEGRESDAAKRLLERYKARKKTEQMQAVASQVTEDDDLEAFKAFAEQWNQMR